MDFSTRSTLTHPIAVSSTLFNAVQRRTPYTMRCSAPSWASEVQMALVACRAQVRQTPHRHVSSSSDASVMVTSTVFGSGSICFANRSPVACNSLALATASRKSSSLRRKRRHTIVRAWFASQRTMIARHAHSVDDCRRRALFITMSSNEPSMTERARVVLACARMQLLKLRKTVTPKGCKYELLRGGMKRITK